MADTQPSAISGAFKKPFPMQVAFFRGKLGNLVPTSRWDDVAKSAHDVGFMVAGAAKADLLTDMAVAIDRTISEGQTLEAFRKDFMATIERRGWKGFTGDESAARRAWRTRLIYSTNATTSYNAGREAQLLEGGYPTAVYRHNDSVLQPRPEHLSWNGLTLPVNHPFWLSHSPQNGWGCRCYKVGARSAKGAGRVGGEPQKALPEDWDAIDPKTGEQVGIDKGWGYAPGASVAAEVSKMAEKTLQWDYQLAKAYMQNVPESVRDQLARSYRALPSVADDVSRYARRVINPTSAEIQPYRTMGLLTKEDASRIAELKPGIDVAGYDYALDKSAVLHVQISHGAEAAEAARGQRAVTVDDYAVLPKVLNAPDAITDAGKSEIGTPLVRIDKIVGDEQYSVVMGVRKKRRMMALQTMWVKAGESPR